MKINVKRSPSIWVLYPILYIIWIPNVANHLKSLTKEWGKEIQQNKIKAHQFVPAPCVILRQRWYRAPMKIPAFALAVASLPDIVHHSSAAICKSRSPQPFNQYLSEQVWLTLAVCCPFEKTLFSVKWHQRNTGQIAWKMTSILNVICPPLY